MRALSSISGFVRCPESVEIGATIHPVHTAIRYRSCLPGISLGKTIMPDSAPQQLLHLVIGGELTDLEHITFKDLDQVDIVGVYPNYASAHAAWKAKAQQTVDNAHMRYFVVHLHRLLDPGQDTKSSS
jgi:Domain of unknown function (DUF4170)